MRVNGTNRRNLDKPVDLRGRLGRLLHLRPYGLPLPRQIQFKRPCVSAAVSASIAFDSTVSPSAICAVFSLPSMWRRWLDRRVSVCLGGSRTDFRALKACLCPDHLIDYEGAASNSARNKSVMTQANAPEQNASTVSDNPSGAISALSHCQNAVIAVLRQKY